MSELNDLRRRVGLLEARAEIAQLVTAYAIACDEHDMPRLVGLFTEDACLETPSGLMQATGRQAIADLFVRTFKTRGPSFHWTHDHVMTPGADPDHATGLVLAHAETSPGNEVSLAAMRYHDAYRREAGRWLFARRRISFLYSVPARDFAQALSSPTRLTVQGRRQAADYPEALPAWQAFEREHGGEEAQP